MTERADIKVFGSTVGYNVTPYYRLLGSLHVIKIFEKLAAENRGQILLIMIPPSVKHRFSKMRGRWELVFFQFLVLLHRSKRHINSFWAHRMFEISSHKVSSILSNSEAEIWISCPPKFQVSSRRRGDWELVFGGVVVLFSYNVTPYYWLLGCLHVLLIFTQGEDEK